ncbi:hypothetical protein [Catellatospora tritici]|uniref:hypothetical protein n=1 Tax=Catellatospora tritici TaxID=2851566 RepID=UPI001C2D2F2F|nr:hypothetical protein [Catellatospora tritici]MBV1852124.1 hypothetical protein [Catellatospora tritici]
MTTVPRTILLAAAVLVAATACAPKQSPTAMPSAGPSAAPPTPTVLGPARVVEIEAEVDLPGSYVAPWYEFSDAQHGYALFQWCGDDGYDCTGRLLATADGGRTWQRRNLPVAKARGIQLYQSTPQQVIIWTDPAGYQLSTDGGHTYGPATEVMPRQHAGALARYGLEWPGDNQGDPQLLEFATGRRLTVPDGFEVATAWTTPDSTVWVTRPGPPKRTARTTDGGLTWQTIAVPEQPGRSVWSLSVLQSADRRDTWLVGMQDPPSTGGGTAVLRGSVLKATGMPLLWRLADAAWVPVPITGIEEQPNQQYTLAAAGDGLLALAGPEDGVYLGARGLVRVPGTPRLDTVWLLPDGTLRGFSSDSREILLGVGSGADREWRRISLEPTG